MKKMLMTVAVLMSVTFLMMAAGPRMSADDDIQQIRAELADLGLRVAKLEHAAGATPVSSSSSSSSGSTAAAPTRTMVLSSISEFTGKGDHAAEIAKLQRQESTLMNAVNSEVTQKANDFGQQIYTAHVAGGVRGWGGAEGGGISTSNAGAAGRQVLADQALEDRYASLHASTKRKLERLQKADDMPRQVILGHEGKTIITLETKRNLHSELVNIAIGSTVTWTGSRQSVDDDSETWVIETIKVVE